VDPVVLHVEEAYVERRRPELGGDLVDRTGPVDVDDRNRGRLRRLVDDRRRRRIERLLHGTDLPENIRLPTILCRTADGVKPRCSAWQKNRGG
jgi:hypothetical protein